MIPTIWSTRHSACARLTVLAFAASVLTSCDRRSPTAISPPTSIRESMPMPSGAIAVDFDNLAQPFGYYWPEFYSKTTPKVTFTNYAIAWLQWYDDSYAGTDHRGILPTLIPGSQPEYWFQFSRPVSFVRLRARIVSGAVTLRCKTSEGTEVRASGSGEYFDVSTLEVQGKGITRCDTDGYAIFDALSFVPEPPQDPVTVVLQCSGSAGANRVVRGEQLRCAARKSPDSNSTALTVLAWEFNGEPRQDQPVNDTVWEGVVAVPGLISMRAKIGDSAPVTRSVQIVVDPRTWPPLALTLAPIRQVHVDHATMADYPPAGSAFGRFEFTWPDFTKLRVRSGTGPNYGVVFLADPVELPAPVIHLHPAMFMDAPPPGLSPSDAGWQFWRAWYEDQNGRGSGTCERGDVQTFRLNVERHEGVTMAPRSHYAVANNVFRTEKIQDQFEAVTSREDANAVQVEVATLLQHLFRPGGPYRRQQDRFDDVDTPNVYNLGCTLDATLKDGG